MHFINVWMTIINKYVSCVVIITSVNCYSVKRAAQVQVIFTVAKVAALIIIIISGIVRLCQGKNWLSNLYCQLYLIDAFTREMGKEKYLHRSLDYIVYTKPMRGVFNFLPNFENGVYSFQVKYKRNGALIIWQ